MWRLLFFLICVYTSLHATNQLIALEHYSIVTKFDLIADEDINDTDVRVKSIIYSARSYKQSKIMINYANPNAEGLATKLAGIFSIHNLLVIRPKQILLSKPDDNKFVQVTIYYQE